MSKSQFCTFFFINLLLVGCAITQTGQENLGPYQRQIFNAYSAKIGGKYWTADIFTLCNQPTDYPLNCDMHASLGTYGPFKITNVLAYKTPLENIFLEITTPEGTKKYMLAIANSEELLAENPLLTAEKHRAVRKAKHDAAKAICNKQGGVSIGMTKNQVLASCWGHPHKKNITETVNGVHEQWVYRSGYLYFDNGVLSGIQTEQ